MIHVLIVEDSAISREFFERQIMESENYIVTESIENAANAVIACMKSQIDLVLMDVCTADDESGLDAAEKIKRYNPLVRVIIMTSMPEHSFLKKAKEAGCDSFWYKEGNDMSLLEVCDRTMSGQFVWPESTPVIKIGEAKSSDFTDRELEVIRALAQGKRCNEIASSLYMSPNTVKYHVKNILQKTGFSNTIQLVAEVVGKRLILPGY